MFLPDSLNQAGYGGGGNRTRELTQPESRNEANDKDGFVYFAQSETGGPIKIGWTTHPEVRLARLQVGNPERLVLIALILVRERAIEPALHKKFAAHRIRGEWFHPHPDVLEVVEWLNRNAATGGLRLATAADLDPDYEPEDEDYDIELLEREVGR